MVPYEEFVEDISEGDQIQLRSSEGEFTGEVLKIRKTYHDVQKSCREKIREI